MILLNYLIFFKPVVKNRAKCKYNYMIALAGKQSVRIYGPIIWTYGRGSSEGYLLFQLFFPFKVLTDFPSLIGIWGDKEDRTFGRLMGVEFRTCQRWEALMNLSGFHLGTQRTIQRTNLSNPQRNHISPSLDY